MYYIHCHMVGHSEEFYRKKNGKNSIDPQGDKAKDTPQPIKEGDQAKVSSSQQQKGKVHVIQSAESKDDDWEFLKKKGIVDGPETIETRKRPL